MCKVNEKLQSYQAKLHIDVALHMFPPLSTSLDGNVYYKQPDKEAAVFTVVPMLASQFKKLYAHVEPPALWSTVYRFEVLSDDGTFTIFRLVPRKHGRVLHLDVSVDDAAATIHGYRWEYEEGGYIAFDQTFTTIAGNKLVASQSGHVELPSYKADVHSTVSDYKLNVPVDDAVFTHDN